MSCHQYPLNAVLPDYLRAGLGTAVSLLPLALVDLLPALAWGLALVAALFLGFAARTLLRQMSRIELNTDALKVTGPLNAVLSWDSLNKVDLRYFSTRRDRSGGWMQLKLQGSGGSIRIDSSLDDFTRVAQRVAAAAVKNGLPISAVTRANFAALDVKIEEPGRQKVWPADNGLGQGVEAE